MRNGRVLLALTRFLHWGVDRRGKVSPGGDSRRCIRDILCNPYSEAPGIQEPGKAHPPTGNQRCLSLYEMTWFMTVRLSSLPIAHI